MRTRITRASAGRTIPSLKSCLLRATNPTRPVPVIRQLMRDFPDRREKPKRRIRLLLGVERTGANDKVAKLCRLAQEADHVFLVITDSDVRVAPGYLRGVIAPFIDARVGAVTALYRAIDPRDEGGSALPFGALMDAVGSSASFAGAALVARSLEGLKFAMGSTVATTRERLEEIGGFAALLDLHSDDYEVGRRIAASDTCGACAGSRWTWSSLRNTWRISAA